MTTSTLKRKFNAKGLFIKSIEVIKEVSNSKVFKIVLITGIVILITITIHNILINTSFIPTGSFVNNLLQALGAEGKELFQLVDPEVVKEGAQFFLK